MRSGQKSTDGQMAVQYETKRKQQEQAATKKMREYLQNRRLLQFGELERIEESSYPSKCRKLKSGGGSFQKKNSQENMLQSNKKRSEEYKKRKQLVKDRNT